MMVKGYAEFIIRHKVSAVILSLIMIGAMGTGAQHLTFTNDYQVFFGENNPQLLAFENIQDTYSKNDNVMLLLVPESGKVFTNETLEAVAWLTERAWQTPYSSRVESLTNFQHTSAEGDDLLVEDLALEPGDLSDQALTKIKAIALNEPVLANRLISAQATSLALMLMSNCPALTPSLKTPKSLVLFEIYGLSLKLNIPASMSD
jgi:predicted RND superfamily exporter protein